MLGQAFAHCPIFPTAASRRSLGRVSVPMWPITLSGRLPIAVLVGRYLTNELIGRELTPQRIAPLTSLSCDSVVLCGISNCFQLLSPSVGQIAHALLTRPPLECQPKPTSSFDLHVLSTPPAFVLSQDQTLLFNPSRSSPKRANAPSINSFSTLSRIDCSLASRSLYRFQGSRYPRFSRTACIYYHLRPHLSIGFFEKSVS